jgi:hypothetical protein
MCESSRLEAGHDETAGGAVRELDTFARLTNVPNLNESTTLSPSHEASRSPLEDFTSKNSACAITALIMWAE